MYCCFCMIEFVRSDGMKIRFFLSLVLLSFTFLLDGCYKSGSDPAPTPNSISVALEQLPGTIARGGTTGRNVVIHDNKDWTTDKGLSLAPEVNLSDFCKGVAQNRIDISLLAFGDNTDWYHEDNFGVGNYYAGDVCVHSKGNTGCGPYDIKVKDAVYNVASDTWTDTGTAGTIDSSCVISLSTTQPHHVVRIYVTPKPDQLPSTLFWGQAGIPVILFPAGGSFHSASQLTVDCDKQTVK